MKADGNRLIARMEFFAEMSRGNDFNAAALRVAFVLLYRHMNGTTGRCNPSIAVLVQETGLSERGLRYALRELEQSGWWQIVGGSGAGRGHTSSYQPNFERVQYAAPFKHGKGAKPNTKKGQSGCASVIEKRYEFALNQEKNQEESPLYPPKGEERERDLRPAEFWQVYPSRGEYLDGEEQARRAFEAAVARGADPEEIIAGARRYAAHVAKTGIEPRFVPRAERWLKNQRWTDRIRPVEAPRSRVSGGLF